MSVDASARGSRLARIFRWPLLVGLLCGFGLVAALLCDGPVDALWALLVAVPLFTLRNAAPRRRSGPER
jgi:hypothetical protein